MTIRNVLKQGLFGGIVAALALASSGAVAADTDGHARLGPPRAEKVLRMPIRTDGPKSLDPAKGSTVYDNQACCQFYDTLLQQKYLYRPERITSYTDVTEPLLLAEMPVVKDLPGGVQEWSFTLRADATFHDDPCFPGGKGRAITADDVFYSWKRLADPEYELENYWLLQDTIVGFDEFKDAQGKAVSGGGRFDYDAPVEGLKKISNTQFQIILKRPVVRFPWVLTMFQTSVVPREAVERYGVRFGTHPVGTGPFILRNEDDWKPGQYLTMYRNPNYRSEKYPTEHNKADEALGLHLAAGTPLPIVDKVEITFYVPDPPMWQDFIDGKIGFTQVPPEYFPKAFVKRTRKLDADWARKGYVAHAVPLLDFIFEGFNMEDKLLGGYDPKHKKLRQALSLAYDWDERNDSFYNGINIIFDGPIPVGLDGYPKNGDGPVSYRGPNIARAKKLLAEAGYPNGEGLPEIEYYSSKGANSEQQVQMLIRQMAKINVRINPKLVDFSELIDAINKKKAPFFGFAWGTDYPDPENNLALFYSKNKAPGANHYNYDRPEYDAMYERILVMKPGPERTAIIEQMRDMVCEDVPFLGSMGRTRYYLVNPWLKNFKPTEDFYNWIKYLDVDESKR
ncbi:MAG: ABC transporter substrate-binding protein [Phycisphaerales bacterium]